MNPPRFTISGLLAGVACLGLVCAALRIASEIWTSIIASLTFLFLMTGMAGACFTKGLERAFWTGVALFGTAYLLLVHWDSDGTFGRQLTGGLSDFALIVFPDPIPPSQPLLVFSDLQVRMAPPGTAEKFAHDEHVSNFIQIGWLSLTLLFALIGGFVSRRFAARAAARSDS